MILHQSATFERKSDGAITIQVSISSTFYDQLFGTEVFCTVFMCLQFGFAIFCRKKTGAKAARKMMVQLPFSAQSVSSPGSPCASVTTITSCNN